MRDAHDVERAGKRVGYLPLPVVYVTTEPAERIDVYAEAQRVARTAGKSERSTGNDVGRDGLDPEGIDKQTPAVETQAGAR
jgi:hypothetical protein